MGLFEIVKTPHILGGSCIINFAADTNILYLSDTYTIDEYIEAGIKEGAKILIISFYEYSLSLLTAEVLSIYEIVDATSTTTVRANVKCKPLLPGYEQGTMTVGLGTGNGIRAISQWYLIK